MSEGSAFISHTQAFGQKNTFFWVRNVQVTEVVEIGDHSKWYRSGNGVAIGEARDMNHIVIT